MNEWAFEQRLCAHLEAGNELVARQLGTGVSAPSNRVADVLRVEPGPEFESRTELTSATIPDPVIAAEIGAGQAQFWKDAFQNVDVHPERAWAAIEDAVEIGFLEAERRNGRTYIRQAARYPAGWFNGLTAIENKPDLDTPGDLETQLRTDVSLGVVDRVVLVTATRVTRAHLHRLPDAVGVWRFFPEKRALEVIRPAESLPVTAPGIELLDRRAGRDEIEIVDAQAKARARRRLAERAYGKGWRPAEPVGCEHAVVSTIVGVGGVPACSHFDQLVNPVTDCGPACPAYAPAEAPTYAPKTVRDRHSPWVKDPPGKARVQGTLDPFTTPSQSGENHQ